MYVCHCNALTDAQIRAAAGAGAARPREVYDACGCAAQCGCCTATVLAILRAERAAEAGGR